MACIILDLSDFVVDYISYVGGKDLFRYTIISGHV